MEWVRFFESLKMGSVLRMPNLGLATLPIAAKRKIESELRWPTAPGLVNFTSTRRALVTILEENPVAGVSEIALLSEAALAQVWGRPEEDEAWSHLREVRQIVAADELRATGQALTASHSLMVALAGMLKAELRNRVVESVVTLLREGEWTV